MSALSLIRAANPFLYMVNISMLASSSILISFNECFVARFFSPQGLAFYDFDKQTKFLGINRNYRGYDIIS